MIVDAKDTPLAALSGGLPNMRNTLNNWFQSVTFNRVSKVVVNFELIEAETPFSFIGNVQPLPIRQLALKPEGQRSWRWITVWSTTDLLLNTDEIIAYKDFKYRVMAKFDWASSGYIEYHCCEQFIEGVA